MCFCDMLKKRIATPGLGPRAHHDLARVLQGVQDFIMNGLRNNNFWLHGLVFRLLEMFAQHAADAIDNKHTRQYGQQNRGYFVVLDQAQGGHQFKADASGADNTQHR